MNNNRTGGLKNLVLQHIEKVAAAVVLGVAGFLVYASTGVETYDKKASDLNQVIGRTESAFRDSTWANVPEENKYLAFDPTDTGAGDVDVSQYAEVRGWSRPVVAPTVDRTDPPLLAALDVEGVGVTGLMGFINDDIIRKRALEERREELERQQAQEEAREEEEDARSGRGGREEEENDLGRPVGATRRDSGVSMDGDELIRTVSCAVVLAKAPLLDQYKAYKEALENARGYNPANDLPTYLGFYVQRAEVREGKTGEWQNVSVTDGQGRKVPRGDAYTEAKYEKLTEEWVQGSDPLMDPAYEDPALTMPLPPLVGEPWPATVVHSDVPLMVETEAALEEAEEIAEQEDEPTDDSGDGFDAFSRQLTPGMPGRQPGAVGGRGARGGRPSRSFRGAEQGGEGMRSRGGSRGGRSPGRGGRSRSRRDGGTPATPHLMVRFFDFTVVPGRQYRYRVRLVLQDVNNPRLVSASYLDRDAAARVGKKGYRPIRLTEWSDRSSVVSIPMAGDVRITEVKPPAKGQANSEASVKFLVQSYAVDEDGRATRSGLERQFPIGSVMNMTADAEVITPDQRYIVDTNDFEFRTGITLAGVKGGTSITREYKEPIRTLLMDPAGRLFVRHEIDDRDAVELHKAIYEGDDDRSRGYGGGRGGGRGGRGRGGEGGGFGEFR
ncbi:MAG: hypothetical protein AAFV43_00445 [Planctomycetota bacterium]